MDDFKDIDSFYRELAKNLADGMNETDSGVSYQCPWHGLSKMPSNPLTGRIFKGANAAILWRAMAEIGTDRPFWASEKAWGKLGGKLVESARPVEIAVPVIDESKIKPWSSRMGPLGGDPLDPNVNDILGFKSGIVYHELDVVGATLPVLGTPNSFERREKAEDLLQRYLKNRGPAVVFGGDIACYFPNFDRIHMPKPEAFFGENGSDRYYGVFFHECLHSTGSPNRCGRFNKDGGQKLSYAAEELVAEIGAAFLASRIGLATSPREDHLPYLRSWKSQLSSRNGGKMLRSAFSLASQGADHIWFKAQSEIE